MTSNTVEKTRVMFSGGTTPDIVPVRLGKIEFDETFWFHPKVLLIFTRRDKNNIVLPKMIDLKTYNHSASN